MFRVEVSWDSGGYGWTYKKPEEVYDDLVDIIGHDEAANVEGWCELASIGEEYNGENFTVYVYEE